MQDTQLYPDQVAKLLNIHPSKLADPQYNLLRDPTTGEYRHSLYTKWLQAQADRLQPPQPPTQ